MTFNPLTLLSALPTIGLLIVVLLACIKGNPVRLVQSLKQNAHQNLTLPTLCHN